ncbi:MAG: acetone carboxylase subunit gamma [Acidibacillus sp.]|uniref:Acetone carboxylase gamma subunit n=1 Tax=Sulfoacidibacillus ferrooxidans TaxID=2005001 RepID=A0A9X1V874_9BACL|nr:Acetone carboxylase gamma subunit [Sulfoacidibacillus ferrooxidans]MCY0891989.1 acetone carboxylase subunit gamma [Acidibacillus sp.]
MEVTKEQIKRMGSMLDGCMSSKELFQVIADEKDPHAFDVLITYVQGKVAWTEPILLPLTDHLMIVAKETGKQRQAIVKCTCGHEFTEYRVNWKVQANVYVRRSEESFQELYPQGMHATEGWHEIREYYCPGCFALLDVEAVPPGYPPVFDALPDLQTFYRDWLMRSLPVDPHEFEDFTTQYIADNFAQREV